MCVVPVVLVHPPAVAETHSQVGQCHADDVVGLRGAEDLPVSGVVPEKAELGGDHCEERRHQQLPP
jgi:hypothetical protein